MNSIGRHGARVLVPVSMALMIACGGSVTAHDAGGGGDAPVVSEAGQGTGDAAGASEAGQEGDAASVSDAGQGADAAGVSDAGPLVDVVDSAPACGAPGQACCGTSCNAGNTCVVIAMKSQCEACGQPGEPCCTTVPACANAADSCFFSGSLQYCMNYAPGTLGQPGDSCNTTCADPTDTCVGNGMSSYCIACGGLGNPCCGATCGTGLSCTASACQ